MTQQTMVRKPSLLGELEKGLRDRVERHGVEFQVYGLDMMETCDDVKEQKPHIPHGGEGLYCLGRSGPTEEGELLIALKHRPVPYLTRSVEGFYICI